MNAGPGEEYSKGANFLQVGWDRIGVWGLQGPAPRIELRIAGVGIIPVLPLGC